MVMEAVVDAFERRREEIRGRAAETRAAARGDRADRAGGGEPRGRTCSRRPIARLVTPPTAARRLRRRPQVPAGVGARVPPGPRLDRRRRASPRLRRSRGDPRREMAGRHLRPGRRRLRPLLGRRRLARPPLREDALRQRAAGARLPARLAGARATSATGASARRRSTGPCARCAVPRAASTRRSTPTPRARREASTSGRRTRSASCSATRPTPVIEHYGVTEAGNFEGRNVLHVAGGAVDPAAGRRAPRTARRALLEARAQRVRPGLDDKRLTSWNALMIAALADAGAVLGRADYLDAARGAAPSSCSARCATRTAACCAPSRTAGPGSTPTSRTTPSCSRRC